MGWIWKSELLHYHGVYPDSYGYCAPLHPLRSHNMPLTPNASPHSVHSLQIFNTHYQRKRSWGSSTYRTVHRKKRRGVQEDSGSQREQQLPVRLLMSHTQLLSLSTVSTTSGMQRLRCPPLQPLPWRLTQVLIWFTLCNSSETLLFRRSYFEGSRHGRLNFTSGRLWTIDSSLSTVFTRSEMLSLLCFAIACSRNRPLMSETSPPPAKKAADRVNGKDEVPSCIIFWFRIHAKSGNFQSIVHTYGVCCGRRWKRN